MLFVVSEFAKRKGVPPQLFFPHSPHSATHGLSHKHVTYSERRDCSQSMHVFHQRHGSHIAPVCRHSSQTRRHPSSENSKDEHSAVGAHGASGPASHAGMDAAVLGTSCAAIMSYTEVSQACDSKHGIHSLAPLPGAWWLDREGRRSPHRVCRHSHMSVF